MAKNVLAGIDWAQAMYGRTSGAMVERAIPSNIQWVPPPPGWLKLNCDGARLEAQRQAAWGGILRDTNGGFVFAFSSNLGECPMLHAELWAMLYEIHFAWASCFRNLYIESDSQLAIDLLKNGCSTRHQCHALVCQIQGFRDVSLYWVRIFWEANQGADCIAKFGLSLDER